MSITSIKNNLHELDWHKIKTDLDNTGYALLPRLLSDDDCRELVSLYNEEKIFRATINMKRYNFGKGEYKYFSYPLPEIIQYLREGLYTPLSSIANEWHNNLKIERLFPASHKDLIKECNQKEQTRPTALILKYEQGDFNTLHQDLYGDVYFPLQVVVFLTEPGVDYTGGEFVLIEQRPRLQSKAIVLQPGKGQVVIFTTNFRAAKGTKGYYRAPVRHGVSEVRSGSRYNIGIIFHDAK